MLLAAIAAALGCQSLSVIAARHPSSNAHSSAARRGCREPSPAALNLRCVPGFDKANPGPGAVADFRQAAFLFARAGHKSRPEDSQIEGRRIDLIRHPPPENLQPRRCLPAAKGLIRGQAREAGPGLLAMAGRDAVGDSADGGKKNGGIIRETEPGNEIGD